MYRILNNMATNKERLIEDRLVEKYIEFKMTWQHIKPGVCYKGEIRIVRS